MELLTEQQLRVAVEHCPAASGKKLLVNNAKRNPPGRNTWGTGSQGEYTYYTVGANKAEPPQTDGHWQGQCFASWENINPSHALQSISYQNPLYYKTIPYGTKQFYAAAWDTVIRPPFADFLPEFKDLREQQTLEFPLQGRSMMEASLYFRLIRIFNECLSFAHTAALLRHRYPDQQAAVLLAATSLGQCDIDKGITLEAHPSSPNSTIGGHRNILACMALVRNYEWSTRNGGWRVEKFRRSKDTTGPFVRRYYGHNHYWFGTGTAFKVNVDVLPKQRSELGRRQFTSPWENEAFRESVYQTRKWNMLRNEQGWAVMDRCVRMLEGAYQQTEGKEHKEAITVPVTQLCDTATYFAWMKDQERRLY